MEETKICCCVARVWTKVIAWLQIIRSVLILAYMGTFLIYLSYSLYPNGFSELGRSHRCMSGSATFWDDRRDRGQDQNGTAPGSIMLSPISNRDENGTEIFPSLYSGRDGETIQNEELVRKYSVIIAFIIFFSLVTLVPCVDIKMAVNLLRGSLNKNLRQINAWIVYSKILLAIWAVVGLAFGELFVVYPGNVLKITSFGIVYVGIILIQGFFIWVVGVHKKEIKGSKGAFIAFKA